MGELADTQRWFLALVTGRNDVAATVAERGGKPSDVTARIAGDARLDAVGRLDIYANMYFLRLEDALLEDYPMVARVLGKDGFRTLALDYLQACPPDRPAIRDVGARLPEFLRIAEPGDRPVWLADLAALEWARADVFDRADAPALTLEALQTMGAEAFATLSVRLVPAACVVDVGTGINEVWRRLAEAEDAGAPWPGAQRLVVWRRGADFTVRHSVVADAEGAALMALAAGAVSFADLCERLSEGREPEDAARFVFETVGGWAQALLLTTGQT